MPTPPLGQQPRVRVGDRPRPRTTLDSRGTSLPAGKPAPRGGAIQLRERLPPMPRRVEQHVPDRIPNLARCLQHSHVVPIRQEAPTPPKRTPHRSQHPPGERLHPPTERTPILRLNDQVRVIPQERVVHHPKLPPVAPPRQRLLKRPHKRRGPQRWDPLAYPERHMARVSRRKIRPTPVTNRRIRPSLASSPLAPPAMPRQRP